MMNKNEQIKQSAAPGIILIVLIAAFAGFLSSTAQQLPDPVATRFGFNGDPVQWMNRSSAIALMVVLGLGLPLLMVAISFATRFLPASLINIPHREYWLAPERRDRTHSFILRQVLWLSCLMLCFMAGIHWIVVLAHQSIPVQMPTNLFVLVLAGYLACMAIWIAGFTWHFRRPCQKNADRFCSS
jgi:uncharacterized membrane protein